MIFKMVDWLCYRLANTIVLLLSLWPRMNKYNSSPSRGKLHVLLIANDLLGDAISRIPFYAALRRVFPHETHHIAVVLTAPIAKFFYPLPYFDEIIVASNLSCCHPLRWIFSHDGFMDASLRWALTHKTDILLNPFRFRSLGHDYILALTNPSISIAYETLYQFRIFPATAAYQKRRIDRQYTHLLPIVPESTQVDEMQRMLSFSIGVSNVKLSPVACRDIKMILDSSVADKLEKPYVVFVPGAGANCRRWPVERFAQVATGLKHNIVVVGTKDEEVLGDAIPRAINLCGKTSLSQLGGILAGADLVIANETGTATYAAVIGARTLCLVGGGDFNAFFPNDFYKNTRSIYCYDSCFSCMWNCSKTDLSRCIAPCVDAISVEEVREAALEMLR